MDERNPQTIEEYRQLAEELEQTIRRQQAVIDTLQRALDEQQQTGAEQEQTVRELQEMIERLNADLKLLRRNLFGSRRERFVDDPGQLYFFDTQAPGDDEQPENKQADGGDSDDDDDDDGDDGKKRKRTSKGRQRRVFPDFLERRRVEHLLNEDEIPDELRDNPNAKRFFKKVSEQLEYEPASVYVIEHYQEVLVVENDEGETTMLSARKPPQLLERGSAGPALLAQLTASRFADHLPYYRQEEIFARIGFTIHRSTQWRWMRAAAENVRPLVELMQRRALKSHVLGVDETPVPMLDPPNDHTRKSYLWIMRGDDDHPYNCFDFTDTRERDGPRKFLTGFSGILLSDAYIGYELLSARSDGKIVSASCWAHARRKFVEVNKIGPNRHAQHVLTVMGQLYDIEDRARSLSAAQRYELRQAEAKPIVDELHEWLTERAERELPKSKLRGAIMYMLWRWESFECYLTDAAVPIDNNQVEATIKDPVIGKKNWLFFGAESGGKAAATLYTLTSTCDRLFIDPVAYLRDVYERLPGASCFELRSLLPDRWIADHPQARLEQRLDESRAAAARQQRRRQLRRQLAASV